MSFDWTKEELLRELKEREEAGEPKEVTFDFVWSVVERAYKERDQLVGVTEAERAAVVAWLRAGVHHHRGFGFHLIGDELEAYADHIERGEHRREGTK
jgi:hypothetical protein